MNRTFWRAILLIVAACQGASHASRAAATASAPDDIPAAVRRRLAQAVWPEHLFDSTGQPEPGFVRRPFRPDFADLKIERVAPPPELANVAFYVGTTYPSGCSHCRTYRHAVAMRGNEAITLLDADDVEQLADWAAPEVFDDSTRLRTFVLGALRSTCLLGCEVRLLRDRKELGELDSIFLRGVDSDRGGWTMPRWYAWQSGGAAIVEFALVSPANGVYRVRADWTGDRFSMFAEPVAQFVFT